MPIRVFFIIGFFFSEPSAFLLEIKKERKKTKGRPHNFINLNIVLNNTDLYSTKLNWWQTLLRALSTKAKTDTKPQIWNHCFEGHKLAGGRLTPWAISIIVGPVYLLSIWVWLPCLLYLFQDYHCKLMKWIIDFFFSVLGIHHATYFWPVKLLLQNLLIALWGFPCM